MIERVRLIVWCAIVFIAVGVVVSFIQVVMFDGGTLSQWVSRLPRTALVALVGVVFVSAIIGFYPKKPSE